MKKIPFLLFALCSINAFAYRNNPDRYEFKIVKPRIKQHIITDISRKGSLIRIEDGSHWKVSDSYLSILNNWEEGDSVIISVNPYFFSFYKYALRNVTAGSFVLADMKYGPSVESRFSKQIEEIDYPLDYDPFKGNVRLTDGSYWNISKRHLGILDRWKEYDYVIIGESDDPYYKYILINVNLNESVDARLHR